MIQLAKVRIGKKTAYFTDRGWVVADVNLAQALNSSLKDMVGYQPSLQKWAAEHAVKLFGGEILYVKPEEAIEGRVY